MGGGKEKGSSGEREEAQRVGHGRAATRQLHSITDFVAERRLGSPLNRTARVIVIIREKCLDIVSCLSVGWTVNEIVFNSFRRTATVTRCII